MRTDAEKQAFAMKCLEIEKEGGDVLGYIEVNWPSYSPRATWYNLQRQYLNRNTNQLTEGKRKEGNELRRDRKAMLDGVLHVLSEKGDPIAWLKEQGYANPNQAWTDLRAWANKHGLNQGRLPGNLSKYYAMLRRQESDEEHAAVDLDQHPEQVKEAVARVFFGGKEYEKMEAPSPTCCQPAPESGVTVPDELPEEPKRLMIAALMSDVDRDYKYELTKPTTRSDIHMALCWRDKLCNQEHCLIFSPADWKKLSKEILTAIEQFGI